MKPINQLLATFTVLTTAYTASGFDGAYYGTNYTAPFAHAYRALKSVGVDPKTAIDRDVYHMSRLGLNAFRLHLWDVELSDSVGNLLANDHLDCLDYLISKLEERNIAIVLTAQTNFGNGYPERNTNPNNAYSYKYDKCDVHDNPEAVKAQERYISQLVKHVNKYTGRSLCDDKSVLAIEINNEPCHSGDKKTITAYVKRMMKALKRSGWHKDIFYNVSHNLDRTEAFFDAPIDGATFQWYPIGLVSGHQQKGNFLPFVDSYNIPFDELIAKRNVAKIVYEFDPADNLYSYLYPAAARTFRSAGFKWVTQFAYDPMDIAWANTEYQTHYLNLAYTPGKALGMMIAAEVVRRLPEGCDYGKYPDNLRFGDFAIDARRDLAMLNCDTTYYYTNSTDIAPRNVEALKHVAGRGISPVVSYGGSGAYFLDKIADGVWRLEVMPDVVLTKDPFAKPSLKRKVGEIIYNTRDIVINVAELSADFKYRNLGDENIGNATASQFAVRPGVYLLSNDESALLRYSGSEKYGDGTKAVGEYVAPVASVQERTIVHIPTPSAKRGETVSIKACVLGGEVDSVMIYPSDVSFWREDNKLVRMRDCGYQQFEADVQVGNHPYGYNIVAFYKDGNAVTYPDGVVGTPLDWDYADGANMYVTDVYDEHTPAILFDAHNVRGSRPRREADENGIVMSKYVADILSGRDLSMVKVKLGDVTGYKSLYIGFVNKDGFTFKADLQLTDDVQSFNVCDFKLTNTINPRNVYPLFIDKVFVPQASTKARFELSDVDYLVVVGERADGDAKAEIFGISAE
jgi:hypothetical protein